MTVKPASNGKEAFGTVYLDPTLGERLRMHCAKERKKLSQAISEALVYWLPTVETQSASSVPVLPVPPESAPSGNP
jgi:hypothetical protein